MQMTLNILVRGSACFGPIKSFYQQLVSVIAEILKYFESLDRIWDAWTQVRIL